MPGLNILRGTFREAYTIEILDLHPSLLQRILDHGVYPLSVVSCSILWQEPLPWGRDIRVSDIGQDGCRSVRIMSDDPCPEFVGRTFQTKRNVRPF